MKSFVSYEFDWVNIILTVIYKELYVILPIAPLFFLLHTLSKDKNMCLQDE